MARVPIVVLGDILIATVQEELSDHDALSLQEGLFGALERTSARGVLLDLSVVEIVDSFLGRLLADIALGARLLGAATVVVGIQPAVAITLVELGLELKGVRTALNANKGMRLLQQAIHEDGRSRTSVLAGRIRTASRLMDHAGGAAGSTGSEQGGGRGGRTSRAP